jgi:hypothetical protein
VNYKKLIAMAVALTISVLVGSTVMAHGCGGHGGAASVAVAFMEAALVAEASAAVR